MREPIFQRVFQIFISFWEPGEGVRTQFSMNVSRFSDFHRFSIIRQVAENLKQSLKMNQKPSSKPPVRLNPIRSQGLDWSLGGDLGESSEAAFSMNVSGFQLLLGT